MHQLCMMVADGPPHIARTQFGQIMDLATRNNDRFIVDRRGEPAVVIMSVQDFIRNAAPPPDWLEKARTGAKRRGLDTRTRAEIDAEMTAHRRKPDPLTPRGDVIRAIIDTNVVVSGLLSPAGNEALILLVRISRRRFSRICGCPSAAEIRVSR
jgi:hypothetical protein